MTSTRLRVRNKKAGETTLVTYKEDGVEKTHLVTFEAATDEPGICIVTVPEVVACALLQGSLYTRMDAEGTSYHMEPPQKSIEPKKVDKGSKTAAVESETCGDDLTKLHGVGPKIALKLRAAGFCSIAELAEAHVNVLVQDCDLSVTFAEKLVAAAKNMLS